MIGNDIRLDLLEKETGYEKYEETKVLTYNEKKERVGLEMKPLNLLPTGMHAGLLFSNIKTYQELVSAYKEALKSLPFEEDDKEMMQGRSEYSKLYLKKIIKMASSLNEEEVMLISDFVKNLDIYTAVRSCETLFSNRDNLELLKLAKEKDNWTVIFDHLAIRTGTSKTRSAQKVVDILVKYHGYNIPDNKEEAFYTFSDGWSAYLLYKLLNNGMVLRLFVDQSDDEAQIIGHWNYVYGYTAHHLGLRIVELKEGVLHSIGVEEISKEMQKRGIEVMQATGMYTKGLLEQAFSKPQKDEDIPESVISNINKNLIESIKNAKLLEIVARKELPQKLAIDLYQHYQLNYKKDNPLFSAPYYNYFLPAQAAHVIKTSM